MKTREGVNVTIVEVLTKDYPCKPVHADVFSLAFQYLTDKYYVVFITTMNNNEGSNSRSDMFILADSIQQ